MPGTVSDFYDECNKTKTTIINHSTSAGLTNTVSFTRSTTISVSLFTVVPNFITDGNSSEINHSDFEVGSISFYVTVALGGVIVILTLCLIAGCVLVFLVRKKGKMGTVTIALKQVSSHHDESHLQDQQQPQDLGMLRKMDIAVEPPHNRAGYLSFVERLSFAVMSTMH